VASVATLGRVLKRVVDVAPGRRGRAQCGRHEPASRVTQREQALAAGTDILEHQLDRALAASHELDKKSGAIPIAVAAIAGFIAPHVRVVPPVQPMIVVIVFVGTAALFSIGFAVVALTETTVDIGPTPSGIVTTDSLSSIHQVAQIGLVDATTSATRGLRRKAHLTALALETLLMAILGVALLEIMGGIS